MRIFPMLIGTLCLAACLPQATPPPRAFAADTGSVLTADTPAARMRVCLHNPRHDGRWTPTAEDIGILDPVLIELIEYRLMEDNLTYEDSADMQLTEYHRHYFGLTQGDERLILVCGRYAATPAYMHDGGPSQFGALYDTRLRTFTWFSFGGRA